MGTLSFIKALFWTKASPGKACDGIRENVTLDKPSKIDLNEWVDNQTKQYGSREGLSHQLKEKARQFDRELHGISGTVLDDLLTREPLMIPSEYWGGDLGWRSERRRKRWEYLLTRNGVEISPGKSGILIRYYMNATDWVPHPYAPPYWAVLDYDVFSKYITPDERAFELCRKWRTENSIILTRRLMERLKFYPVELGASYRLYEHADIAEVGFLYNPESSAFRVTTVWQGETVLAQLIRSIFPDACREYSPDWLLGQRLDVYVPSIKVAFEYQGEQHYAPVGYFGGKQGYKEARKRDLRKKQACQKAGVLLIEWKHSDSISKEHLIERLRECGIYIG